MKSISLESDTWKIVYCFQMSVRLQRETKYVLLSECFVRVAQWILQKYVAVLCGHPLRDLDKPTHGYMLIGVRILLCDYPFERASTESRLKENFLWGREVREVDDIDGSQRSI